MEKGSEINHSDSEFIEWLSNRLHNLHSYDLSSFIINRLSNIKEKLDNYDSSISDADLDKIISQYFLDFFLNKDHTTSIGYTDKEREDLRNVIKQIVKDVNDKRIPNKVLLQ